MKRLITTLKTKLRYLSVPYFRLGDPRYDPGEGAYNNDYSNAYP